ncbi:MAG: GxxExxY protein [Bacteroidota bacterium]
MTENEISKFVFDAALKIHKKLGPGLLESTYEACMEYELTKQGLQVETQVPLPLIYEDVKLSVGYRLDLLINEKVVIEIKAVEKMHDLYFAQLLTYLKLSESKLGLLINFNVVLLKDGFRRVVNQL